MNKQYIEKVFSKERFSTYLAYHKNDENKALLHYRINIKVSESLYPVISTLEVSLKNSVNRELIRKFGTQEWYNHFPNTPGLSNLVSDISEAQNKITKRKEIVSPSKIVAELTLGFWVRLFNAEYHNILWKDLRRAFPFLPKIARQRKTVSGSLNRFRILRNRIFHNEPICWNFDYLEKLYNELWILSDFINDRLPVFLKDLDNFPEVLLKSKNELFKT